MLDFDRLCLKPDEIDTVLYHGDCVDGFASAFCCWLYNKKLGKKSKKITYIACQYQKSPPILNNRNILMCDFSYKYDILKNLLKNNNMIVLDHHHSAEKDLKNIPNENKVFNSKHSGAYITWAYFFGEDYVPMMIKYIQENDLCKKSIPNVRQFTSYIFSIQKTFENYEKFIDDTYVSNTVIPLGDGMMRQNDSYINEGIKKVAVNFIFLENNLYFVGNVNTSILKSEVGNAFLISNPDANFATSYSINEYTGETYISLRSNNTGSDVGEIASKFGGGGHRNSAGVSVYNSDSLPSILIDRYQCFNLIKRANVFTHKLSKSDDLELNIAYLNSYHHKRHLGKYLLQKRCDEEYNGKMRPVSEAVSIIRNRTKDPTYYIGLDISVIYYYDESDNNTYFSIIAENLELLDMIKEIYKNDIYNTDDSNITTRLKIKLKGLKNRI